MTGINRQNNYKVTSDINGEYEDCLEQESEDDEITKIKEFY